MLGAAHTHSSRHADEVRSSVSCGCFYCLEVFSSNEITHWIADEGTALCPRCGIDAVIGDLSGFPVGNRVFLQAMHRHWF
ncbi:cytoplasmic protein [Methylobacterium terrae]|uniref:Cytoplasmic protein n=1 Tax=Methylobacterium terrae TaxID=2202827 RepID=A0A2U8WHK7_9HYPH|nr:cytoplasmic protein [Methylobacterium terrae]